MNIACLIGMAINGAIDGIRDMTAAAIQVNPSMVTIVESKSTKRLAAYAAIFAVSKALAGFWGSPRFRPPASAMHRGW